MTRRFGLLLAAGVIASAQSIAPLAGAQSASRNRLAEAALQAAMHREAVIGDLAGAIEDYRTIATRFGREDGATAADALMRAGSAAERLGKPTDARADYSRVLRDFSGQTTTAVRGRAGARLAALAPAATAQAPASSIRRVMTMSQANINALSADGTLAVGVSGGGTAGELFVLHLASGQTTSLRVTGAFPIFSRDAQQVAFVRTSSGAPFRAISLHVAAAAPSSQPRTLVGEEAMLALAPFGLTPFGWSPDGRTIYALVGGGVANTQQGAIASIVAVSTADGTVHTVKTFAPREGPVSPRLSPDGQTIAYSSTSGSASRPIVTIDANGQNERVVVAMAGWNMSPFWAPDGARLFFANNPLGTSSGTLWSVPMNGGQAAGNPATLSTSIGITEPILGFSASGSLYTFRFIQNAEHVLLVDRASGSSVLQMFPGGSASLSPDGRSVAMIRLAGSAFSLIVRDLESGSERLYPVDAASGSLTTVMPNSPRWLPDGSGFLVRGARPAQGQQGPVSIYFIHAKSGQFRLVSPVDAAGHARGGGGVVSGDGKTLYLVAKEDLQTSSPWSRIVGVDLTTGMESTVVTLPSGEMPSGAGGGGSVGLVLSPDGTTFALFSTSNGTGPQGQQARLFIASINGGGLRQIAGPFPVNGATDLVRWTPNGQSILFAVANENRVGWRIMRVPAAGGTPVFDGLDSTSVKGAIQLPTLAPGGPFNIDLNPDGTRMTVGARTQASNELWAIDGVAAPR